MLIDQIKDEFNPEVRRRGRGYASGGHVTRLVCGNGQIRARVRGTSEYEVTIGVEEAKPGWVLWPSCNCIYGDEHEGRCKHVWAVLMKAEEKWFGGLGPAPSLIRMGVLDEDEEEENEELEEEDDSGRVTPSHDAIRRAGIEASGHLVRASEVPPPKPKPEKPPGWVNLLSQAPTEYRRESEMKPAPEGALTYVVDAERSYASSALVVALMTEGDGKKRKRKRVVVEARHVSRLQDAKDRVICGMLLGAASPSQKYAGFDDDERNRSSLWQVQPRMLSVVMPLMQETGRLYWCEDERSELEPLRWDGAQVWERVVWMEDEGDRGAALGCRLRRVGDARTVLRQEVVVVEGDPGAVLSEGVLSPLVTRGDSYIASWLESASPRGIKREHLPRLMSELGKKGVRMPVVWPASWQVREVRDVKPQGRLTLLAKSHSGYSITVDETAMTAGFEYGEVVLASNEKGEYAGSGADGGTAAETVLLRRDADCESALIRRLLGLGATRNMYVYPQEEYKAPKKKVASIVIALLREGWEVRGDKMAYRRPGEVKIEVSSGIDWFDVQGSVKFDGGGSAGIAELLDALKRGEHFVVLGDGSMGMLPEEWLEKHGGWLRLGKAEADQKDAVRFSKAQLGLIDALLAEMPEATCDAQVNAARKRLAEFQGVKARREPKGFKGELREYQREGLGWLRFLGEFGFGGILADDMGLGKTVQLLAHLVDVKKEERGGVWLVVAPKSLVYNWAREAARFAPGLKVVEHAGLERRGRTSFDDVDLVLTTYGTMRRDLELLSATPWGGVVLDEAQAIKTGDSQAAKAARVIGVKAQRRCAPTGTPVENRLGDLWSIMEFLNPGMLGGAVAFREAMASGNGSDGGDLAVLRRAMRPFILRRTKERVAPELPARSEQTIVCELSAAQRKLYDGVLAHYRAQLLGAEGVVARDGMNGSRMHVLEALLRLRQAACHAALLEVKPNGLAKGNGKKVKSASSSEKDAESGESAKLDTLMEMLTEMAAEGHRALVFSQFTSLLALLRERLRANGIAHEYLDGKTAAKDRAASVDRFQAGADGVRVFLISLKAGGVGLNLTAADYVFLLDPWWNPAVEAQAIDRAHRIGQTKSVIAYRLIARGTVEEKIQELQASKRELAAAIVGEESAERNGPLASLTREELGWLLGA